MIIDDLKNIKKYKNLFPNFEDVFDFISDNNLVELECGRYEISKGAYVNIEEYSPKVKAVPEVHKKYTDIQIILQGEEKIGFGGICENFEGYDTEKDVLFLGTDCEFLSGCEGRFFVFFNGEVHAPCLKASTDKVKKAVFKIPAN